MDQEYEKERQTFQICRLGFAMISFALVLACGSTVLALVGFFVGPGLVGWITRTPLWRWLDAPIVWGCLVGTYLLWGRFSDVGWQRRTGLLLLMGIVDVVLWFLEHGEALGLRLTGIGHDWLRDQLGQTLGWGEFALLASLSGDLMAHLGVVQAPEAGKATRSLAATGAAVWMLSFLERTSWNLGWPLQQRGIASLESLLLMLGSQMLWAITLIQVTAMTIATTRQATRVLEELDREDRASDLLKLPSDFDFDQFSRQARGRWADDDRPGWGR